MPDQPDSPPAKTPAPEDGGKKRIAVAPRQMAASGDREPQAPAPAMDPASLGQQIAAALLQVLGGNAAAQPPAAPTSPGGLIAREEKRFRRGANEEEGGADAPAEPQLAPPVKLVEKRSRSARKEAEAKEKRDKEDKRAPEENKTGEEAETSVAAAEGDAKRSELEQAEFDAERGYFERGPTARRAEAPPLRVLWKRIPPGRRQAIVSGTILLILAAGFLLGRLTAPEGYSSPALAPGEKPAQAPLADAPQVPVSRLAEPEEIRKIDEISIAQSSGNFSKAEELLLQFMKQSPDVKGVQLTLALLNLQRNEMAKADYHISLGLTQGEDPGRLHGLRALIRARTQRPKLANESFVLAQRGAPFDWKNFFLHAEYLRRGGKSQEALEKIDQALARVHEQSEEDLMQFKRRLVLIALGRGAELDADIQKQLAVPIPNLDWLLTAFAREASQGNFAAATVPLKRATETASQDLLAEKLRDFYLFQYCYEKELEPYFRPLMAKARPVGEAPVAPENERPDAAPQGPAALGAPSSTNLPDVPALPDKKTP